MMMVLPRRRSSGAADPRSLFGDSQVDLAILPGTSWTEFYQERTGASATTVAGNGDPVGTVYDVINNNYWITDADVNRPTYRVESSIHSLEFDGANTYLRLATPAFSLRSFELFAGMELDAHKNFDGVLILAPSSGNDYQSLNGCTFTLWSADQVWALAANNNNPLRILASTSLEKAIFHARINNAETVKAAVRRNGADEVSTGVYTQLSVTHNGDALIGCRYVSGAVATGSNCFDGHMYGIIARNAVATAGERTAAEEYLADLYGVTL